MKEYLKTLFLIIAGLAFFIPLASTFPDGLESVAEKIGIEVGEPLWGGIMPDYRVPSIDNAYVSTFLSGALGTLLVLLAAFIVGKAVARSSKL